MSRFSYVLTHLWGERREMVLSISPPEAQEILTSKFPDYHHSSLTGPDDDADFAVHFTVGARFYLVPVYDLNIRLPRLRLYGTMKEEKGASSMEYRIRFSLWTSVAEVLWTLLVLVVGSTFIISDATAPVVRVAPIVFATLLTVFMLSIFYGLLVYSTYAVAEVDEPELTRAFNEGLNTH